MGTGLIFAGFIFLINPDFVTLDVLPDFIGYILISAGFYRLSFLEERIRIARTYAHLLILCSVIKLLASPAAFAATTESTRLTVSFFFCAAEAFLCFCLADSFFKGLNYLAVRQDSNAVLKNFEVARTFVIIFLMAKSALSFLPQSVIVFFPDADADPDVVENYLYVRQDYQLVRNACYLISFVALVAFGIYTARIIRAYIRECRADTAFCGKLRVLFDEKVTDNESMKLRISIRRALLFFTAAPFFLLNFYLDGIDVLPRPFFFVLLLIALRALGKNDCTPFWKKCFISFSFVFSVAAFAYRVFRLYTLESFNRNFPYDRLGFVLGLADEILALVCVVFMFAAIRGVARRLADFAYTKYAVFLFLMLLCVCVLSFFNYHYTQASDVLPAAQWAVFIIFFFFHKKSLDGIGSEIEWKYM